MYMCVCVCSSSNVPIIGLVINNDHYRHYRYRLLLKDLTDIVISVLIMSFLVIIASLIAFMILIIIEKMLFFIERIRNHKVDIILNWYRLSVHI